MIFVPFRQTDIGLRFGTGFRANMQGKLQLICTLNRRVLAMVVALL